jgi:hypothetical protein
VGGTVNPKATSASRTRIRSVITSAQPASRLSASSRAAIAAAWAIELTLNGEQTLRSAVATSGEPIA